MPTAIFRFNRKKGWSDDGGGFRKATAQFWAGPVLGGGEIYIYKLRSSGRPRLDLWAWEPEQKSVARCCREPFFGEVAWLEGEGARKKFGEESRSRLPEDRWVTKSLEVPRWMALEREVLDPGLVHV